MLGCTLVSGTPHYRGFNTLQHARASTLSHCRPRTGRRSEYMEVVQIGLLPPCCEGRVCSCHKLCKKLNAAAEVAIDGYHACFRKYRRSVQLPARLAS